MRDTVAFSVARLIPLAFLNFTVSAGAFFIIGLVGPLMNDLALTKVEAAWIMSAYALAYAATSPVLVSLTGRFARRDVILAGIGLFIVGSLASAAAGTAASLYLARMTAAVGAGLTTPVVAAVAAASATPEQRGAALSTVFAGMTLAQVIGVPAGAFIGFTFGSRVAFLAAAGLCACAALWVSLATPRDTPFVPQSLTTLGRTLARLRDLMAVLLTVTITVSGYIGMTFMGPLAEMRLGMGRDGVALFLVAAGIGAFSGNVVSGHFVDRFGATAILAAALVGQIVMGPLMTLVPFGLASGMAMAFLWSFFSWGFTVPQQARLIALDPAASGVMLALNAACIYLGSGIGAGIAGAVNQRFGIEATGIASALIGVFGLVHLVVSERMVRQNQSID